VLTRITAQGLEAVDFSDRKGVENAVRASFAVVTATGVASVISDNLDRDLFAGKVLANIGAEDEFGEHFDESEVLFGKFPINFSLPDPTKMRYLDPIMYAHNLGPALISELALPPGFHTFPEKVDQQILQQWVREYQEDISVLPQ